MNKVYAGTIGVDLVIDTGEQLADADEVKILWRKPSGATGEWVGSVFEETKIRYVTNIAAADSGTWRFHAWVVNLGGWTGPGNVAKYGIYPLWR